MRIVFNLQNVGLGNNGGSRTLIKCAETLKKLGQDVIISTSANNYAWEKINVEVVKQLPSCDILVATGYGSVSSTLRAKARHKYYYIRGFEKWRASESQLFKSYKSLRCIVNSEWLEKRLASQKVKSQLIYPGLDFEDFYIEKQQRKDVLGGLFSSRHATKRHKEVIAVGEMLEYKTLLVNHDIKNATPVQLRSFYNKMKVWMSPTELEGLHNCPMEAGLCGCGLVVTDHPQSGMQDYAVPNETALVYPAGNLGKATNCVQEMMNDESLRKTLNDNLIHLLKTKIGDRQTNMKKMLDIFAQGVDF